MTYDSGLRNPDQMTRLSASFRLSKYAVICARGKQAYDHEGNKRFRSFVRQHKQNYAKSKCKFHKSKIVSHIVNTIRDASPEGGFVKFIDGYWYEVGDRNAREKVGQTFRDLLHTQYSSSTKAKAKVRQQRRTSLKTTSAEAVSNHPHETSPDYCKSERESPDGVPSSVFVVSDSSTLEQKSVNDYDIIKEKPGCVVVIRRSKRRKMKRRNALDEHDISSAIAIADAVSSSGGIYQYENNKHCSSSPNTEDVSSSVHAHHDIEPLPLEASEVEINFDDESGVNKLILEDSEQSFEESMRNLYYCFHATSL